MKLFSIIFLPFQLVNRFFGFLYTSLISKLTPFFNFVFYPFGKFWNLFFKKREFLLDFFANIFSYFSKYTSFVLFKPYGQSLVFFLSCYTINVYSLQIKNFILNGSAFVSLPFLVQFYLFFVFSFFYIIILCTSLASSTEFQNFVKKKYGPSFLINNNFNSPGRTAAAAVSGGAVVAGAAALVAVVQSTADVIKCKMTLNAWKESGFQGPIPNCNSPTPNIKN